MFRFLRTKLAFVFAALFTVVIAFITFVGYLHFKANAEKYVSLELQNSVELMDTFWRLKEKNLFNNVTVSARDFGLREVVASNHIPTIRASLTDLKKRLKLDTIMLVTADGNVISDSSEALGDMPDIYDALQDDGQASGALTLNGTLFQVVAAPVKAPITIGWLILGAEVGKEQIDSFRNLVAIPIDVTVKYDASVTAPVLASQNKIISIAMPLDTFTNVPGPVVHLSFPLNRALDSFQPLMLAMILLTLCGVLTVFAASWRLSASLTHPITTLERALILFSKGTREPVSVNSNDEVGRLAESFNLMIDQIHDRELEIRRISVQDFETGLPNRRAIEEEISHLRDLDKFLAVTIRIKRYNHIRNAIGHRMAAKLLVSLAERLSRILELPMVARVATADLCFMLPLENLAEQLVELEMALTHCSRPVRLEDAAVDLVLVGGIALGHRSKEIPLSLIDQCHIAVDQADGENKSMVVLDTQSLGNPGATLSLMSEMIFAIRNGEMALALQPKLSLTSGKILSMEALVRWQHHEKGFIPPDAFIPIAEETGHIRQLTEWVVKEALRQQQILMSAGHEMRIAVNISGRQITDATFVNWAIETCKSANGLLCFEVTETAIIDDMNNAVALLNKLRANNIKISIDDYGTGLSSLSYIQKMPADELKIDRCFVMNLTTKDDDKVLVKSTVEVAHALGMTVVAEGVEDPATLKILGDLGVDMAQGYYISRPIPLNQVIDFLSSQNILPRAANA